MSEVPRRHSPHRSPGGKSRASTSSAHSQAKSPKRSNKKLKVASQAPTSHPEISSDDSLSLHSHGSADSLSQSQSPRLEPPPHQRKLTAKTMSSTSEKSCSRSLVATKCKVGVKPLPVDQTEGVRRANKSAGGRNAAKWRTDGGDTQDGASASQHGREGSCGKKLVLCKCCRDKQNLAQREPGPQDMAPRNAQRKAPPVKSRSATVASKCAASKKDNSKTEIDKKSKPKPSSSKSKTDVFAHTSASKSKVNTTFVESCNRQPKTNTKSVATSTRLSPVDVQRPTSTMATVSMETATTTTTQPEQTSTGHQVTSILKTDNNDNETRSRNNDDNINGVCTIL